MRRSVWFGVFGALIVASAVRPAGAATCPGDCSGTQSVLINNLITCVSIALETEPVSACPACDVNMDDMVTVNEVIAAVNSALDGCPGAPTPTAGPATPTAGGATPTASMPICGNGVVEGDEDCDPPNLDAEQECAANCTFATRRTAVLDPAKSLTPIQFIGGMPLKPLPVSGTQVLTTGRARDNAVFGPGGKQLFAPGEAPIAVKAKDVNFNPISVNNLACACVRAIPEPAFSVGLSKEGISGIGVAGCGPQGLSDIDVLIEEDHDTNPSSPGNGSSIQGNQGLPDDPDCSAQSVGDIQGTLHDAGMRISSNACLEGVGETCSAIVGTNSQYTKHFAIPSCVGGSAPGATTCTKATETTDCPGSTCAGGPNHDMACNSAGDCGDGTCTPGTCKTGNTARAAACNSPRKYTFSGGPAPRGSVLLINQTSQTLLPSPNVDACAINCSVAAFGTDCTPCTDDDVLLVPPMIVPTTSGTATIRIYDANDVKGAVLGDGAMCGGTPCLGSVKGEVADCDALKNDPNAPLSGALVTAAPNVDTELQDAIVLTTLKAQTP